MLLSLSFHLEHCSLELLEELSRHENSVVEELKNPDLASGSVVLATCNRFEVYADTHLPYGEAFISRIAAATGLPQAELEELAVTKTGPKTAEHLFKVASGLESAVVGEHEIAGQVRRAHTEAREQGTLTHDLEHLFRTATRTSRTVGHRTSLRSTGRSLVRLALRIAEARIPDWKGTSVLLIGTGEYAGATVSALRSRGAEAIMVYSPSGRASDYAARHGLTAISSDGLDHALAQADLVIACTRADRPVLTPDTLARTPDEALPSLFIDLGMPRNIDASIRELRGAQLLDLETITAHASVGELSAESEAHEIVRDAALEFTATQAERDALPALLALRRHVLGILEDELCRSRRPSGTTNDSVREDASIEEAVLRRFTSKLLHTPMTRIRTLGREGRVVDANDALASLFGIAPHEE
ncbi:MAG: glutamyl-tRNA reductase [Leucobacter sp.]